MPKAADVKGRIVPLQSCVEKTRIVIQHIHFQLFFLGSNGEVPFVQTSSHQTEKEVVSLVPDTSCGFQCQRSSASLVVIPGQANFGFKGKEILSCW